MTPDSILKDAKSTMDKAFDYLKNELKGLRTGRASPALVEYVKVDYYGSQSDLKSLAAISVPEATQILIKPFDPASVSEIKKAIEAANLGLNPMVEAKQIRVNIPPLSKDRRQQLVTQAKKLGEDAKIAVRNVRRDANKHAEQLEKDKNSHLSEDQIADLKDKIQSMLKQHETDIDKLVDAKSKEVMEV
ncbi:MAG TPA: ribosome recycling factor [Phycisphaerales bacterium]|nr:ribosome recycling factor [Phycisphaerales bacterium]